MGVASLLSLLRNRAVFWLKTIFCVSYLFFFICLFFVFVYLYLADHQGGWEFCLLPDPLADVSLDPGSQSPQACVTIRPQWTQDALSPESDLQPAHFPPSPSKPLATCVLVWDTIDRFNRWQILFLSKKLIRFQIRIHVSKKKILTDTEKWGTIIGCQTWRGRENTRIILSMSNLRARTRRYLPGLFSLLHAHQMGKWLTMEACCPLTK